MSDKSFGGWPGHAWLGSRPGPLYTSREAGLQTTCREVPGRPAFNPLAERFPGSRPSTARGGNTPGNYYYYQYFPPEAGDRELAVYKVLPCSSRSLLSSPFFLSFLSFFPFFLSSFCLAFLSVLVFFCFLSFSFSPG